MNRCAKCGATGIALTRTRLATHNYPVLGMPVELVNAVDRFTCTCGHSVESIPNHEGLLAAVALCRVLIPMKLNGNEIRLLRKTIGWKAIELASRLDVTPETLSRWENGPDVISNPKEKNLRLRVALALRNRAPAIDVDLEELMAMEITPVRPANWPILQLEAIRVKDNTKKETQYDKAA